MFSGPEHISKYCSVHFYSNKVADKSRKIAGWYLLLVTKLGNVFRFKGTFIYNNICKNMWKIAENCNIVLIVGNDGG